MPILRKEKTNEINRYAIIVIINKLLYNVLIIQCITEINKSNKRKRKIVCGVGFFCGVHR